MKPLVALVVDHPLRDLPGITLLAYRLAQSGVDVCLVPLNLLSAETFALAPDFLLMNNIRRTAEPVLAGCMDVGIAFGMLDTEGGLYGDLSFFESTFTDRTDIRGALSCNFLWGRRIEEFLLEKRMFRPDQLHLTGTPRFDYYSRRWRAYYARDVAGDGRPMVLIPTKVAVSNPQGHSVEKEVELLVDKLGLDREMMLRWRDVGFEQIRETIAVTRRLATDLPEIRFVLRPHPHEQPETYRAGLADVANVEVIREGTVDHWILGSRVLVHRMCTTAVEAMLADVPSVVPAWMPTAANAPDTEAVSVIAHDYDTLRDAVAAATRGENLVTDAQRAALARIVDDWFHAIDGASHERVAEVILSKLPDRRGVRRDRAERHFFRSAAAVTSARGFAGRLGRAGARMLPGPVWGDMVYPHRRRWATTSKAFDVAGVQRILDDLHATETSSGRAGRPARAASAGAAGLYPDHYQGVAVLVTAAVPARTDGATSSIRHGDTAK